MKKIKLVSLITSGLAVCGSVPVIATSCSKKTNALYSTVTSDVAEVTFVEGDTESPTTQTVTFTPTFIDTNYDVMNPKIKWIWNINTVYDGDGVASKLVNFSFDNGKLTIKYNSNIGDLTKVTEYKFTVQANTSDSSLKGSALRQTSIRIRVIPANSNILIFDGEQIQLAENIELSAFCWNFTEGKGVIKLPLANSETKTIEFKECRLIEEVLIQKCGKTSKAIGDEFLSQCQNLEFLYISSSTGAESIGNNFLRYCVNLPVFDFGGFRQVKNIGDDFLRNCSSLRTVQCSYGNLTIESIGNDFMLDCSSLEKIDFSFFTSASTIDTIGESFLDGCSSLTSITLNGFENVKTIGQDFMYHCFNLGEFKWIDNSFCIVSTIGENFMCGCISLIDVDFSFLESLTTVGNYFLNECYVLNSIKLPKSIKTIGNYFLANCLYGLENLDLSTLVSLETIGSNFLDSCYSLVNLSLPAIQPPTLTSWGIGLDSLQKIHCSSSLSLYKSKTPWSDKADLMVQ